MSNDLSKLHRMRRILLDEEPTDCSPLPVFPSDNSRPAPVSADIEVTAAKVKPAARPPVPKSDTTEMLQQQKQEIAELREAISEMSSEIDRLHTALTNKPDSSPATQNEEPTITGQHAATPVNRILLLLNGNKVLKYPLHKSSMTVGRSSENDIQISTEFVSRVHARITSDANGAVIEDLNSRNGVVVNSTKVSRKKLCNGDMVALGKTQFKFIDLMDDMAGEGQA